MRLKQLIVRIWNKGMRISAPHRSPFTLVELLVAMAVLSLLMLMIFRFLGSAQSAWSMTNANTRVYENARIALDIVSRDLKNATASDAEREEIPFYYNKIDRLPTFVAATDLVSDTARSKLCEIRYSVTDANGTETLSTTPQSGLEPFTLYRSSIDDNDPDDVDPTVWTANPDWDFFAVIPPATTWEATPAPPVRPRQPVTNGIESLEIRCFYDDPADATDDLVEMATGSYLELPAYAQIVVTVFDESLADADDTVRGAKMDQTKRTFTKIVFLGGM